MKCVNIMVSINLSLIIGMCCVWGIGGRAVLIGLLGTLSLVSITYASWGLSLYNTSVFISMMTIYLDCSAYIRALIDFGLPWLCSPIHYSINHKLLKSSSLIVHI